MRAGIWLYLAMLPTCDPLIVIAQVGGRPWTRGMGGHGMHLKVSAAQRLGVASGMPAAFGLMPTPLQASRMEQQGGIGGLSAFGPGCQ